MLLHTERLTLRRFKTTDSVALLKLLGSRAVMASSVDGALNKQQIDMWLNKQLEVYKSGNGIEVLAVAKIESPNPIGYCGLFQYSNTSGSIELEIGYRFVAEEWGNGYATEAAFAMRDYAFSSLNISRLVALIEPVNTRSIRVAEKLGMKYENAVMLEGYDRPDYLYAMRNPNASNSS